MELLRVLAALSEPPTPESKRLADLVGMGGAPDDVEWTELFALQLPPYASIYLSPDGRLGGEARDRVAGFWRALGLTPPAEPDHLPVLLAFQAELADRAVAASSAAEGERWRLAARAFLHEHVMSWMPFYLAALGTLPGGFYRAWAELLAEALADAVARHGALAALPAALRESTGLALPNAFEPAAGEEASWLDTLLAPLPSGVFLPRARLAAIAGDLELGERLGERRLTLRTLLSQDASATLGRLAGEARRAAASHRIAGSAVPVVAAFWLGRARACADLLEAVAAAGE